MFAKHGGALHPARDVPLTKRKSGCATWEGLAEAPDAEIWAAHREQKRAFVAFATERFHRQHAKYGESPQDLHALAGMLDPEASIIGFARRMTGYKRPWLVLSDHRRLLRIFGDSERPVQIVFARKAHPLDDDGQAVIEEIYPRTRSPDGHKVPRVGGRTHRRCPIWRNIRRGSSDFVNDPAY